MNETRFAESEDLEEIISLEKREEKQEFLEEMGVETEKEWEKE